jgi:ribosomal-protein-alanine N-acetyltransferase
MSTRPAEVADCDLLSEIHSAAFQRGWSGAEFEALLVQAGVHALIARSRHAFGWTAPAGFVLYRHVGDEAEILSIAAVPDLRRRGVARELLQQALRHLYREGVNRVHLEVEESNVAAINLYRGMEFRESGKRAGYYAQGRRQPAGALVMVRQLR